MSECKFKVGDVIRATEPNRYNWTNSRLHFVGQVMEVHSADNVCVKTVFSDRAGQIGQIWDVDPQYFEILIIHVSPMEKYLRLNKKLT